MLLLLAALAVQDAHVVKKGDLVPVLELDATYHSLETHELRLRFESGAVEAAVLKVAPHGGTVKKGEILLALESGPLERQIAAAEHERRGARAALDKAKAERELGARADALALALAENAHRDATSELRAFEEVEGKHLLLNAELQVKQMEDMIADQQEELAQLEKMYKSEELTNATSEIVVRRARRGLERTRIYAAMARESSDLVVKVRHPVQRRRLADAVETAAAALPPLRVQQALARVQREVELAKAEAAFHQQEEQLGKLKKDLESTSSVAPFDGRVFWGPFQNGQWTPLEQAAQPLRVGEKAQAGAVLLTLCGPALRAHADLPEAHYFAVEPGSAVQVTPVSRRGAVATGRLSAQSFAAQPRGAGAAFDALLDLEPAPTDVLPGMKAKARLTGRPLKDVLLVPTAAVTSAGDKHSVKVLKDGKPVEREVEIGGTDGTSTAVLKGLAEGESVSLEK